MKKLPQLLIIGAISLSMMSACGPKARGTATPQAAEELADIVRIDIPRLLNEEMTPEEETEEFLRVISEFRETADVNTRSKASGLSILHIACIFKRVELARCLLADGANPNARIILFDEKRTPIQGDTPLICAATSLLEGASSADMIALIDYLINAGADINMTGSFNMRPLDAAAFAGGTEAVYEHLLTLIKDTQLGWKRNGGIEIPTTLGPCIRNWPVQLKKLLEQGADPKALVGDNNIPLISSCIPNINKWTPQTEECINLLLEYGADINATDSKGRTPLYLLTSQLMEHLGDEINETGIIDRIAYMLKLGARYDIIAHDDESYPSFSAYDFISIYPSVEQALINQGFELTPPKLQVPTDDAGLLAFLCRAKLTEIDPAELSPYFEQLLRLFSPTQEMLNNELYPTALEAAMIFMVALDTPRANAALNALPLWQKEHDWKKADPFFETLLHGLVQCPQYEVLCEHIIQTAEGLMAEGHQEPAATIIELLSRCPDGHEPWLKYQQDNRPAMAAGAYCAQLLAEGLPLPKDGEVQAWLSLRGRKADTPALEKAQLLTSLDMLWMGTLSSEDSERMLQLMDEIGAPEAARQYRRILPALHDPEKLDEIAEEESNWKFELEKATAKYILSIKDEFLTKVSEESTNH